MLGKLIKHEISAMSVILTPTLIVWLGIVIISKLIMLTGNSSDEYFLAPIIALLMIFSNLIVIAVVYVIIISRFYKSTLGNIGYLTFTLPVKAYAVIFSKLIASVFWTVLMCIVSISEAFILLYGNGLELLMSDILPKLTFINTEFIIYFIIDTIVELMYALLTIYAAIAIASIFNKHRVILSFLFYFGITVVTGLFESLISPTASDLSEEYEIITVDQLVISINSTFSQIFSAQSMLISLGFSSLAGIVLFIVTSVIFKKHLNLH